MTTPPTHSVQPRAQNQQKGRSGCLKGCLIVVIVLVLLLVASTVLALTAGRAYVTRHLPEWETRYPLLGLGIDLLSLRDEFAAQGGLLPGGGRQAGSDDKTLLPSDVVVHPSPKAETYNISPDQVTAFQRVAAPQDEVVATLRDAWIGHDWSLHDEREIDGAPLLIWQKADRVCRIEVVAADRGTEIWLRCSTIDQ